MKSLARWCLTALCITALVPSLGGREAPDSQERSDSRQAQPRFETRAEVVLVDVTVVSNTGEPVTGLNAADFKLTVNGQPRAVNTVQFISSRGMKAPVEIDRLTNVSSNEGETTGRLLLFVIDENYLRVGAGTAVLRTAERVMNSLGPGDLVGVARLPSGRGGVNFTTNRDRVRRALSTVMGAQPARPTERVRLSEAHAFDTNDRSTWEQVINRECGEPGAGGGVGGALGAGFGREACENEVEAQAKNVLTDAAARTRQSISGYEQLAKSLALMKVPVNIILISEGLYVGRDRNDLTHLADLAAKARTSFYVVQPDESLFDNDMPRTLGGFNHETVVAEGLEQLAGLTRGSYFKVAAAAAGVFDRISRELSGYYLLSFEPTDADRTSRDRRIKVEVGRRGLTVRARSTYAIADDTAAAAAAAAGAPEEHVKTLLMSPLPTAGLPIRVATYSVTNSAMPDEVRVILSAEIGEPATSAAEWPVGILVFDREDKVFVDSTRYMTLAPATERTASPRLLTMTMSLKPGEYTLRLAAMDHEGKAGAVHHTVDARLNRIAGNDVQASDLIISSEVGDGGAPRPVPTGVHYSETMYSIIELVGDNLQRISKSSVAVQIAENEAGPALVTANAQPIPREKGRAYAALLKLGVLPPGEYVARAVVSVPGQSDAVVTRAFRLAPVAAATDESPIARTVSVDEAPAPLPMAKIAAPVARFAIEEVLKPEVVRAHLDFLERAHPVSEANRSAVQQAREGKYALTQVDGRGVESDEITLSFIRGLALLEKKQYAQAAGWFQIALKGASDFLGAAVYLGAVHAAAGRDNDAIGAWQMATIGDDSTGVYPLLVDAMLRVGDAQGALDMIAEAPEAWPTEDARLRRVATAQAMLGQFAPSLEALAALLQRHPNDPDLLFVAIQVMYRQHLSRPLEPADKKRFEAYAQRYEDVKGAEAALVRTWRRFVLR